MPQPVRAAAKQFQQKYGVLFFFYPYCTDRNRTNANRPEEMILMAPLPTHQRQPTDGITPIASGARTAHALGGVAHAHTPRPRCSRSTAVTSLSVRPSARIPVASFLSLLQALFRRPPAAVATEQSRVGAALPSCALSFLGIRSIGPMATPCVWVGLPRCGLLGWQPDRIGEKKVFPDYYMLRSA